MKIGIVEDHRLMMNAYKLLLSEFECVIEAFNGFDMIQKFKELGKNKFPDLLIVDVNMPVMNGFETVEWLKSNFPKIKIIIVSARDDDETILRMIKLGVNSYLSKSVSPDELIYAISELSEKDNYYTSKVAEIVVKSFQNSNLSDIERKIITLTKREVEIIKLICEELTTIDMADKLCISPRTIEAFMQKILSKLEVKSRVGIALFAERHGLLI